MASIQSSFSKKLTTWLPDDVKTLECKHHVENLITKLHILYEKQRFCDIVLIAVDSATRVSAHRVVLSASSDYFLAMFGGTMKEAEAKEVEIEQVHGTILKTLLDFMYTGSIEVRNETVEALLRAADLLQLNAVVTACSDYMLQQLDLSNCLGIALIADQHSCTGLHEISYGMACKNFEKVCTEVEFFQLNDMQLSKLLSSDDICVSSEEKVFHSLVAWHAHNSNHEKLLLSMMSHIRFQLLKPSFIRENKYLVCKSPECEQLISKWLDWHKNPSTKPNTKPRRSNRKFILLSRCFLQDSLQLQTYDPVTDEWTTVDVVNRVTKSTESTWIYANNSIIRAGGAIQNVYMKNVECLDLQTLEWTDLPAMRKGRCFFGMAVLNGQMYAVGGCVTGMFHRNKPSRSVEKYDFSTGKWHKVASLRYSSGWNVQVVALNGLLYAIDEEICSLESYDPLTDKWTRKAFKNERSQMVGFAAAGGYLYAVGGCCQGRPSKTVERYDPSTDCWTMFSPLKFGLMNISVIGFESRLMAFAGHDGDRFANIVREYDPETDTWKYLAPIKFFRHYVHTPSVIN